MLVIFHILNSRLRYGPFNKHGHRSLKAINNPKLDFETKKKFGQLQRTCFFKRFPFSWSSWSSSNVGLANFFRMDNWFR